LIGSRGSRDSGKSEKQKKVKNFRYYNAVKNRFYFVEKYLKKWKNLLFFTLLWKTDCEKRYIC